MSQIKFILLPIFAAFFIAVLAIGTAAQESGVTDGKIIVQNSSLAKSNTAIADASPTPKTNDEEKLTREQKLLERIEQLEKRLQTLEAAAQQTTVPSDAKLTAAVNSAAPTGNNTSTTKTVAQTISLPTQTPEAAKTPQQISADDRGVLDFFRTTTLNFNIDGYYGFNFNRPYNRFNQLRAYDVSSNSFSLNQANIVVENAPNAKENRRFGFRFDLQYGQATETLQGNPNNELRPNTFRPVWQAYGTYVAPIGKRDVTLDFGKWASSLGYETNYTKDNFNYSRSFFFNFLPFYHFGLRASVPVTKKLTATYWLVNGAQQSEDFNGERSQAVLLTYKPIERVTLQGNYYVGREQRDQALADETTPPNVDITRGRIVPRGRFHVLDAYATFLLTDKLTFAIEGDYVINRVNRNDRPSRVTGGVAYLRYQLTPKFALAGRGEYLSDRGGLFSGATQALKETTFTAEYKFAEGFLARGEYRRDWSNQPYFLTNDLNVLKKEQNTATLGLVWWFGRKQGAW